MEVLRQFIEWPEWETLSHVAAAGLFIYIGFLLISCKIKLTINTLLLMVGVLLMDVLVHQNINQRNLVVSNKKLGE